MFPLLFSVGGISIPSYGFFIALGYLACVFLTRRLARVSGLPTSDFSDICFVALLSGIVGARGLFVLTNLGYFRANAGEVFNFWGGGLVFFGGFLFALVAVVGLIRWKRLPLARSLDILAPGLALGHAIGRLGCFAAGCCHGSVCHLPWGMRFHSDLVEPSLRGIPIHPTQLYESGGLAMITIFLVKAGKKELKAGSVAALYLVSYSALRFVVELFRGDSVRGFVPAIGLTTSQAVAVLLFAAGLATLARGFRRNH